MSPLFSAIPEHLNHAAVMQLIFVMDSANVCCGYPQSKYIEMADARKGIFKSKDGVARAKVDTSLPVTLDGEVYHSTYHTNYQLSYNNIVTSFHQCAASAKTTFQFCELATRGGVRSQVMKLANLPTIDTLRPHRKRRRLNNCRER